MTGVHADLVLQNGKIATLDRANRMVTALAAREGRILVVGDTGGLAPLIGPKTQVVDLAGRTAIPGIVDSHCHPDSYAIRITRWHDLSPDIAPSKADVLERIQSVCQSLTPK